MVLVYREFFVSATAYGDCLPLLPWQARVKEMESVRNQPIGSIIRDGDFRQKALKHEQRAFGDLNVKKLGLDLTRTKPAMSVRDDSRQVTSAIEPEMTHTHSKLYDSASKREEEGGGGGFLSCPSRVV
jgi:hypothetical protein